MVVEKTPAIQNILFVSDKFNYNWQLQLSEEIEIHKVFKSKEELLKYIRKDDTLYISSLLILDGTDLEKIDFLSELKNKKVIVKSLLEPYIDKTPTGIFMETALIAIGSFLPELMKNYNK